MNRKIIALTIAIISACCSGQVSIAKSKAPKVPSLDEMVIYEVGPRLFAKENTLDAVRKQLDKIKGLGCNVIWLMPIYDDSPLRYGSPYSIRDMYIIGEEHGGIDALQRLVNAAHKKGICVILDLVTWGTGPDCQWVLDHPSWYREAYPRNYKKGAYFNWENPELREVFLNLMRFWIDNTDVDGFRCDTASPIFEKGVKTDDWKWILSNLRASYPSRPLILLAEAAPPRLLAAGFDLNYAWHYCDAMEKLFKKPEVSTKILFDTNTEEMEGAAAAGPDKARMRYSTNHDKCAAGSPAEKYGTQRGAMVATALAYTMGGVPLVYSSQEIGYPDHLSFYKGKPPVLDWNTGKDPREEITKLIAITLRHSMRKGGLTALHADKSTIAYLRADENEQVLVLANVRGEASDVPLADEYLNASYTDLMTNLPFKFKTNRLEAYQYLILLKK